MLCCGGCCWLAQQRRGTAASSGARRHISRIADENPDVVTKLEHYNLPGLIVDAMVTNLRITKEQKITMVERIRTKYRRVIFNTPTDARPTYKKSFQYNFIFSYLHTTIIMMMEHY